jgi:hypothetical protein
VSFSGSLSNSNRAFNLTPYMTCSPPEAASPKKCKDRGLLLSFSNWLMG